MRTLVACALTASAPAFAHSADPQPLPGTQPLTAEGDIASQMVAGIDKFLLRETDESVAKRERHWKRDFSSTEAYNKSIKPNRKRLKDILGIRDDRVKFDAPELVATVQQSALVAKGENYEVFAIRWPVLKDPDPNRPDVIVYGEGLLCVPSGGRKSWANVIAIPDADQTPEQIVGLTKGVSPRSQFARRLAENGCRVVIPSLVSREMKTRNGRAVLTNREFIYRGGFEVGRHIDGYEVQKVLSIVDWLESDRIRPNTVVLGYGEGGILSLYSSALDTRIVMAVVSGSFGERENLWQQPIDRNVFGLLDQFGDAELGAMLAPRGLYVMGFGGPKVQVEGKGGAPGSLTAVKPDGEYSRAALLVKKGGHNFWNGRFDAEGEPYTRDEKDPIESQPFDHMALNSFLGLWGNKDARVELGKAPVATHDGQAYLSDDKVAARQARQVAEIDRHIQLVLRESPYVREQYMKKLYDAADTKDLAAYEKVADEYRKTFYDDVIGRFDNPVLPANPRTRKAYDTDKFTGYEVMLDVFPDVFAYGLLLLPKDLKPGEKRPVVVCQHGLEGRPKDVVEGNKEAYHDFAAKLCERGFITFAPQNPYIFEDRFRTLQRKANPLGKTLFSIIVPQHQQITDWLKTLPMVDGTRIGFYGLSYGGKSAMRIPPLVKNYCLSICSADFNDWVDKNASTRNPHSYVWSNEYEIFEWDLASRFNYAEMAALIAPRPFMVERGHFDGVASDETVASEFAKVKHLYAARLGIGDRCEMETFVGPHTINGQGTFRFLHKHLNWPEPK
jgi:dienelactone hydrolase